MADRAQPRAACATPRGTITVTLPGDVLFEPDSAALTPGAATQLAALRQRYLAGDSGATVTVVGHTDVGGGGPEQTAFALSTARAAAVRDWLTAHATPAAAITIRGVGDTQPLDRSDTPLTAPPIAAATSASRPRPADPRQATWRRPVNFSRSNQDQDPSHLLHPGIEGRLTMER